MPRLDWDCGVLDFTTKRAISPPNTSGPLFTSTPVQPKCHSDHPGVFVEQGFIYLLHLYESLIVWEFYQGTYSFSVLWEVSFYYRYPEGKEFRYFVLYHTTGTLLSTVGSEYFSSYKRKCSTVVP